MTDIADKVSFELEIVGAGVAPDTTSAGDLAELLQNVERAILETARSQGREIAEEPVVSLIGVEAGSNKLRLAVATIVVPAASLLSQAVAAKDYERIPTSAHEAVYAVSNQARRRNWCVRFLEQNAIKIAAATISEDSPVPPPPAPPEISGTTSVYGMCIRVGGVTPKAELRLPEGGILYIDVSEETARELARSLYEEVCVEGEATWSTEDWRVVGFKATCVTAYRRTDVATAFRVLAEASDSRWDGVDVEEYVRKLRAGRARP